MVAAWTGDSQAITYRFKVTGAHLKRALPVGIYRSTDGKFDAGDLAYSVGGDLVPKGFTRVGTHQRTVVLPKGLPPNPDRPFVLIVADPMRKIRERNGGNNVARFRTFVLGVVTHGVESSGKMPSWVRDVATTLRAQEHYNGVITFDWAEASRMPEPGQAAAAGQRLAQQILNSIPNHWQGPVDLHLISHGRGAVVIDQALQILAQMERARRLPWQLQSGYVKMTMLDPHLAREHTPPLYSAMPVTGDALAAAVNLFESQVNDPDLVVPRNVDKAEVYYQQTNWWDLAGTPDAYLNMWGEVPANVQTSFPLQTHDLTSPGLGFNKTVEWYAQNIVPTLSSGL